MAKVIIAYCLLSRLTLLCLLCINTCIMVISIMSSIIIVIGLVLFLVCLILNLHLMDLLRSNIAVYSFVYSFIIILLLYALTVLILVLYKQLIFQFYPRTPLPIINSIRYIGICSQCSPIRIILRYFSHCITISTQLLSIHLLRLLRLLLFHRGNIIISIILKL